MSIPDIDNNFVVKIINEDLSEKYNIQNIANINFYRCNNCDFYTKHLISMKRHLNNKSCKIMFFKCENCGNEFKTKDGYNKHINRKKKCEKIEKFLIENDDDIEKLKKENELLKKDIENLKYNNLKLKSNIDIEIGNIHHYYANLILEKNELLNKNKYIYNLEYKCLYNVLINYPKNDLNKKKQLFYLLDIINENKIEDFINNIKIKR